MCSRSVSSSRIRRSEKLGIMRSLDNTERMLQRPLLYPTFAEARSVSAAPFYSLQSKGAESMGNEISESGWTMYLDESINSRSRNISSEFDIHQQSKGPAERYPTCHYQASSFAGNEQDSSMASVASSRPQKPLQDIEFEQDFQSAGSYISSVSRRKRDVRVSEGEDFECSASGSSQEVNCRKNKLRKLTKYEDEDKYEDADLLLQDTASSPVHSPESGLIECEAPIEQNLELQAEILDDIEGEGVDARLETLRSLLPDGAKIRKEEILGVTTEYIRALKRSIQLVQILTASSKYSCSHISIGCLRDREECSATTCYTLHKENAAATATDGVHKHHFQP